MPLDVSEDVLCIGKRRERAHGQPQAFQIRPCLRLVLIPGTLGKSPLTGKNALCTAPDESKFLTAAHDKDSAFLDLSRLLRRAHR